MSDFITKYINYASYENTKFRVHAQVCRERRGNSLGQPVPGVSPTFVVNVGDTTIRRSVENADFEITIRIIINFKTNTFFLIRMFTPF